MVSIVLLTTEEVLQRNSFWYCLDAAWDIEDMEPFEEVKREHMFAKPLSRDFYYTKFPEIPRSESDEENSLSLNGFRSKHREWKSKICLRKYDARRRNSTQSHINIGGIRSNSNNSLNNVPTRNTSLPEKPVALLLPSKKCTSKTNETPTKSNDEKVRDFFKRLLESVPPPPIEDLQEININRCSILAPPKINIEINDIELPKYEDFESNKILQTRNQQNVLPATSTLKKTQRRVSFNLNTSKPEFESNESWYDSIYGVSDLISISDEDLVENDNPEMFNNSAEESYPSWSEILDECEMHDSIVLRKENSIPNEEVVSRSHCYEAKIQDLEDHERSDDEIEYARFAIYKIHQTMKIQGNMIDSSSMKDFSENECKFVETQRDPSFFGTVYSLVPNSIEDTQELVNNAPPSR